MIIDPETGKVRVPTALDVQYTLNMARGKALNERLRHLSNQEAKGLMDQTAALLRGIRTPAEAGTTNQDA